MKQVLLAAICWGLFALPTGAADLPPAGETIIRLSEGAQRMVVQDKVRALLRVETTDPDARQVQAEVNRRMGLAVAKAKDTAGVTVETGRYHVYEDRPQNRPRRWVGSQTLTLTSTETAALLPLVGQLQADGLLMSGLGHELSIEQRRRVERELIPEAVRNLKEKAAVLAASLELPNTRFIEIRLRDAHQPPPPRPMQMMAVGAAERAAPPPVAEPGEVAVSVQLEADIMLSR